MNAKHLDQTPSRRAGVFAALALALLLAGLGAPSVRAAECPNEAIREEQGAEVMALPDCRALEMVSPPRKENQNATLWAVSANGDRVQFTSVAALGGTPGTISYGGDTYVATRGAGGWSTQSTTPPAPLYLGWEAFARANSFTPDFSSWLQIAGTEPQITLGIAQAFQGGLGGIFTPLSPLLVPDGGFGAETNIRQSFLQGASADHSHLYFSYVADTLPLRYFPADPAPAGAGADGNVYLAFLNSSGEPSLALVARDKDGKAWGGNCGARIGGFLNAALRSGSVGERNQGAVSPDGSRTYFSTRPDQPETGKCEAANKLRIMVRTEMPLGPEVEELFSSECGRVSPACSSADGDDFYQSASIDQTKVYFTTNRQLTNSDLDGTSAECSAKTAVAGCDLYLYNSTRPEGERLTQVSAGDGTDPTPGEGAGLYNGIAAISGDGSHAYFVATGVLTTTPNTESDSAEAGEPNLYLYERDAAHPNGRTAFIGMVDPEDRLWGESYSYPVPVTGKDSEGHEVGGDGHTLLFKSKAELSAEDADGTHIDIYRYDAESEALICVSCAPGGPDNAAFDASGGSGPFGPGTDFAEEGRGVSEDGQTVAFVTAEGLLPEDENGIEDSYLWREGQLFRLPGTSGSEQAIPRLSHDGSTAAFTSSEQLLPQDGDSARDTYVARANGGYLTPPPHIPCTGEACQEPFASQPGDQGAASASFSGPGNPKSEAKPPKRCPKGKRKVRRGGKARCVKQSQHKKHANRRAAK